MEKKEEDKHDKSDREEEKQQQPLNISPMEPTSKEAYGGGLYGKEEEEGKQHNKLNKPRASETQSADGPAEATIQPKHTSPPSTGDRDLDITGQSYIQ